MPAFWYSPNHDGALIKVDLVRALSDLKPMPRRTGSTAYDQLGQPHRFDFGAADKVYIEHLNFTQGSVWDKLRTMETAIRAGRSVTFSRTPTKLWVAGIATGSLGLTKGDTTLETSGNFMPYETVSLVQGDKMIIESGNPEGLSEVVVIDTISGPDITLASPVRYTRDPDAGVIVRWEHCWPSLTLPEDARDTDILYAENGRLFNLELTMRVNYALHRLFAGGTVTATEYEIADGYDP